MSIQGQHVLLSYLKTPSVTRNSTDVASPGNILDLVLTINESFVKEVTVHPYAFDSDHHPVTLGLNIKAKRPNNVQRRVYCYKKADLKHLKETLQILNWDLVLSDTCINTCLDGFQGILSSAIDQHIPLITLKKCPQPPWIDNVVMKLIRKKKRQWKCIKSKESADLFEKFKALRRETKKRIDAGYCSYLHTLSEKLQDFFNETE